MPIFKNRIFFVKHNKNLPILADFFWSAVRPRVFWRIFGLFFCPIFYDLPHETVLVGVGLMCPNFEKNEKTAIFRF